MHGRIWHKRVLIGVAVGWSIALIVVLLGLPREQSAEPVAALRDAGTLCTDEGCDDVDLPQQQDAPAAPKRGTKRASRPVPPRPEVRQVLMRPPYNLRMQQVALTCGFHDSCKRRPGKRPAYAPGLGLDWNDNNGTVPETRAVYFTASAHAPKPNTRIGQVAFEYHRPGRDRGYPCATLVAVVRSYPSRAELFRVMYQHVTPVRGLRSFWLVGGPVSHRTDKPNVVVRIGTMVNDPCPYFSKTADGRPLLHAHVEPQRHNSRVTFRRNVNFSRPGTRAIPDVNGCGGACDAVYPGPRWSEPYWKLWTHLWRWTADPRTGTPR